jgi:hypothetical protein
MKYCGYRGLVLWLMLGLGLLMGCSQAKEGRVLITDQEFSIRQNSDNSWVVDAKGKIKNVGEADVKNVVVTGRCNSCSKVFATGQWFVSRYEKMPDQKAVIAYLPVGAEKKFDFKAIAFIMEKNGASPVKMPMGLECEVVSFEPMEKTFNF